MQDLSLVFEVDVTKDTNVNKWDEAIKDARALIDVHKRKIQALRGAILGFQSMRDQGVPWPDVGDLNAESITKD